MKENMEVLEKINELNKKYEETFNKRVDYTIIPFGLTKEKLVKVLERMIKENESLVVSYGKLFKK